MTLQGLAQILASGLLMGLIYALIAAGLSLIFGLMDVVNFAHGEFLMLAMYATFGIVVATALDPVLAAPLVVGAMFVLGAFVYFAVIRHAMRAKANIGMVQVFATFGLGITIRGLAQHVFTPDYRSIQTSFLAGRTLDLGGVFLPLPQLFGGLLSCLSFVALYFIIRRTDFGRALEATREDAGAVALVGIDKNRVFALGWGLGAALVGIAGSVMAIFYYIHPDVGTPFALIAYVTVALGGFGSIFGALAAGLLVGIVEAISATILSPSMKAVGIYLMYLVVVFMRPRGLFGNL
ncbi:MAG: branched-chain amino acid ABC transporter permease [Hyphomicrobiales bacterium]|nr:branched-chain amino acid ABC transporter permease [Hyphomicrobiales bacterium]MBV9520091.1 branched-chain amino acid ABC transporter permease [Hyphomicrobiales bacterium]